MRDTERGSATAPAAGGGGAPVAVPLLADPSGWFTLKVPEGWSQQTEDCVTVLHRPGGAGVVYLCGGRHARGKQASFGGADFLSRFLHSLGLCVEDAAIASHQGVGSRIYSYAREDDGAFWHYWSVTDDETVLLISYTCASGDANLETPDVELIVQSVRLYHSVAH